MAKQRMAGSQEFKSNLMGADAWNKQAQRENITFKPQEIGGGSGSTANSIAQYTQISNSANQNNGNFSIGVNNKYTNNAREHSRVNKAENAGFSDRRINNNSNFATAQADKAAKRNEGYAMGVTNDFVNNAKAHREDNTAKASQFANQTVQKYMAANRQNQTTDTAALDRTVRKMPIVDKAYSDVQGSYTYGDMYRYGREDLPGYKRPKDPSKIEGPNFGDIYDNVIGDIEKQKINA